MTVTFIFMMFVLKIPILALLLLVWWAIRAKPEPDDGSGGDGGIKRERRFPRHPRRRPPRGPRRGPHGGPGTTAPPRMRPPAPHVTPLAERHRLRLTPRT